MRIERAKCGAFRALVNLGTSESFATTQPVLVTQQCRCYHRVRVGSEKSASRAFFRCAAVRVSNSRGKTSPTSLRTRYYDITTREMRMSRVSNFGTRDMRMSRVPNLATRDHMDYNGMYFHAMK